MKCSSESIVILTTLVLVWTQGARGRLPPVRLNDANLAISKADHDGVVIVTIDALDRLIELRLTKSDSIISSEPGLPRLTFFTLATLTIRFI